jgi:hypothetical protein
MTLVRMESAVLRMRIPYNKHVRSKHDGIS